MIHRPESRSVTAKVCTIVLAVSDTPDQSITEVARRIGLPVSTTHRLLYELVDGGLVERSPDGRFTVRVELQPVLRPEKRAAQARALVETALEDLAVATGLRARFGVWHPAGISYSGRSTRPRPAARRRPFASPHGFRVRPSPVAGRPHRRRARLVQTRGGRMTVASAPRAGRAARAVQDRMRTFSASRSAGCDHRPTRSEPTPPSGRSDRR